MAIALVDNGATGTGLDTVAVTINSTGGTLIVVGLSLTAGNSCPITDNKTCTWTPLTNKFNSGGSRTQLHYAENPNVGSSHTITATGVAGSFTALFVAAFSGTLTASVFDVENGANVNTGVATSLAPGSITPTQDNALVVSVLSPAYGGSSTIAIDNGMSITNQIMSGDSSWAGALAYKVQTTAAAINPLWSWSNGTSASSAIASFKASAADTLFAQACL